MKNLILITSLASGLLGGALVPQSLQGKAPQGQAQAPARSNSLSKVFGGATNGGSTDDKAGTNDTVDAWRERMAATDLAQREKHYEQMLAAARRDPQLRQALEDWSNDTSNLDLAWTARLALRELESDPWSSLLDGRNGMHSSFTLPMFDLGAQFDPQRLFEQMQNDLRGFDPNGLQPLPGQGQGGQGQGGQVQGNSSAESFSLSLGPDGVKCEVKSNVDGKEETQEYKAESLDQLLEAHPELRSQLGTNGLDLSLRNGAFGTMPRGWGLRLGPSGSSSRLGDQADNATVRTDILGVIVQPLSANEAKALDLDSGTGLRIDRVEPGTIASSMGLQRGHVLIELNGTPVKNRDDITAELKKRGTDAALEAVVIDRWGQRRTHTWKPDTAKQL